MIPSSDPRCTAFYPGHKIHWIHGGRLMRYDDWTDVEVHADPELDLICLVLDGRQQIMWHHDVPLVAEALGATQEQPQWCTRYSSLMVPGAYEGRNRSSFFYLATPERVVPCRGRVPRNDVTMQDHGSA
ncbi:hypothetical protein ITX31_07970 [Arthrobacter gandavensis]|uniref:hypothetical protein n=1 Tax=Arthrobacter gandavensis TaxID=169960 RepID=UPI00188FAAC7|nr:hypothetical protein [Arthrobacter gandavensis]MBF4994045.1 hypothetical protein [Arthrobacter gandavensis]